MARTKTFDECAAEFMADHEAGWRNAKHREQWERTLQSYASPAMGKLPAAAIDASVVLRALKPIWTSKPETASRLRGRIESVLDWARVHGFRTGENPARWKGNLDHLLPAPTKVRRVVHHPALPYSEVASLMARLADRNDVSSLALRFVILTAARTGEALGATWSEISLQAETWWIPAERMKAGKDHRVPLSKDVLAILRQLEGYRVNDYVFPGGKDGRPLSNMSRLMLLRRLSRDDITVHGFRSSFRDWAAERTNFPREVAEAALAHSISSEVEAAYRRSDLFEKRKEMMEAWAQHCATISSSVPADNVTATSSSDAAVLST